jgi:hypothetical protein
VRPALAAVAVALVAAGAPAHAQEESGPILRGDYGGGWAGQRDQLWLRAEPAEGGQALQRVLGLAGTACGAVRFTADGVPAPGGAFDASGRTSTSGLLASWRVRGAIAGSEGRGTFDARVAVRRGGRTVRRCTVRARPWVIATGDFAHGTRDPPAPRSRWNGTTGGDGIFSLLVGREPSRISRVLISADMTFCPRRTPDRLWAVLRDVPVEDDGSFRVIERLVLREPGIVRRLRVVFQGRFDFRELDASLHLREVTRRARGGARVSACETGSLEVEAAEAGAVLPPRD